MTLSHDLQVDLVSIPCDPIPFVTPIYDMQYHPFINFAVQSSSGCTVRVVGCDSPDGYYLPIVWAQCESGLSLQLWNRAMPRFIRAQVYRTVSDNPCMLYVAFLKPDEPQTAELDWIADGFLMENGVEYSKEE